MVHDTSLIACPHAFIPKTADPSTTLSQLISHTFLSLFFNASTETMIHHFNHSQNLKALNPLSFYICPQTQSNVQPTALVCFYIETVAGCCWKNLVTLTNVIFIVPAQYTHSLSVWIITVCICNSRHAHCSSTPPTAGSLPR